jgi:uridine phosphorylase
MDDKSHHLQIAPEDAAGNGAIGRYFLIPGSPGRARLIAERFDVIDKEIITLRHNDSFLGRVRLDDGTMLDVAATSSGMGAGSAEIVANEIIEAGGRRLIRVGTSGSVQHETVGVGSFVIATGAVRDEMASRHYAVTEFPALAHPDVVLACERTAFRLGLADRTFKGVVHTKGSLFARAHFKGPMSEENRAYKEHLIRTGVVSSEMEASVLFVLASTLSGPALSLAEERSTGAGAIKAGTVLGIIGGKQSWVAPEEIDRIELETCNFAIESLKELHRIDRLEGAAA